MKIILGVIVKICAKRHVKVAILQMAYVTKVVNQDGVDYFAKTVFFVKCILIFFLMANQYFFFSVYNIPYYWLIIICHSSRFKHIFFIPDIRYDILQELHMIWTNTCICAPCHHPFQFLPIIELYH